MRLYSYFRSSAAYRVRIALNLKAAEYQIVATNLLAGEQQSRSYLSINRQGLLPALELDSGEVLTQSPAILEWLEERYPRPALYPPQPLARARMRAVCSTIACDIHPLDNLRVLRYLDSELDVGEAARRDWYHHWIRLGFSAIEPDVVGPFAAGDGPSMADVYLVPQVYNALRFGMAMDDFPRIQAVHDHASGHDAFRRAHPDNQADAR